jgi:hypothetical protein
LLVFDNPEFRRCKANFGSEQSAECLPHPEGQTGLISLAKIEFAIIAAGEQGDMLSIRGEFACTEAHREKHPSRGLPSRRR